MHVLKLQLEVLETVLTPLFRVLLFFSVIWLNMSAFFRMRNSSILIQGGGALAAEVAKNLILAGMIVR